MRQLIGLILFALIYGVFGLLSHVAKKAAEKQKQEAAERQRKLTAARQQQDTAGRAASKKKFREIEQLRNTNDELSGTLATTETVSLPRLRHESMFDAAGNEPLGVTTDISATMKPVSEPPNPIAQGIMAMLATPQSLQQAIILSEIFNRPKYE